MKPADHVWAHFDAVRDNRNRVVECSCKHCDFKTNWPKVERLRQHIIKCNAQSAGSDVSICTGLDPQDEALVEDENNRAGFSNAEEMDRQQEAESNPGSSTNAYSNTVNPGNINLPVTVKLEPMDEAENESSEESQSSDNRVEQGSMGNNHFAVDSVWNFVNCERNKGTGTGRPSKASCKYCNLHWNWPKIERVRAHLQKFHKNELVGSEDTAFQHRSEPDCQTKCLLCRTYIKALYTPGSVESPTDGDSKATTHAICTVLKLDESFHSYFKRALYCKSCTKLVDKVVKALDTLNQVQRTLASSRRSIEELLTKNLETVSTYLDPLRPRRSSKRDNYDETVRRICEGLSGASRNSFFVESESIFEDVNAASDSNGFVSENQNQLSTRRSTRMCAKKKASSFRYESATSEDDMEFDDSPNFEPAEYLKQEPLEEPSTDEELHDGQDDDIDNQDDDQDNDQDVDYMPSSSKKRVKVKSGSATESAKTRLYCEAPDCVFSCFKPHYLQFHIRKVHEGDKLPYFCDKCPQKFASSTSYSYHQRRHTHQPNISCEHCGKLFYELWQLRKHNNSVHLKKAKSKTKVTYTKTTRTSEKPGKQKFHCTVEKCHFSCFKEAYLQFHVREKHEGDPKPYFCDLCPMTFSSNTSYHYHHKRHTSQPTLTCTYCSKLFYEPWQMKKHIEAIHLVQKKFRCQICSFKLDSSNQDDLKSHQALHEDRKSASRPYSCVLCDNNEFVNYRELRKHIGLEHRSGTETFACSKCAQKFISDRLLKIHNDGKFCEPNPDLKCVLCPNYVARNRMVLLRHISSHEQDRQYVCEHCGHAFKTTTSLRLHSRIHTGEKPHKCATCGKAFRLSHLLRNHEEIHLETKSYECKGCGKKFRALKNLRQHTTSHCHSEGPKRKQRVVREPQLPSGRSAGTEDDDMEAEVVDAEVEQLSSVISIPEPQHPSRFQYPPFGSSGISYAHMYHYH